MQLFKNVQNETQYCRRIFFLLVAHRLRGEECNWSQKKHLQVFYWTIFLPVFFSNIIYLCIIQFLKVQFFLKFFLKAFKTSLSQVSVKYQKLSSMIAQHQKSFLQIYLSFLISLKLSYQKVGVRKAWVKLHSF